MSSVEEVAFGIRTIGAQNVGNAAVWQHLRDVQTGHLPFFQRMAMPSDGLQVANAAENLANKKFGGDAKQAVAFVLQASQDPRYKGMGFVQFVNGQIEPNNSASPAAPAATSAQVADASGQNPLSNTTSSGSPVSPGAGREQGTQNNLLSTVVGVPLDQLMGSVTTLLHSPELATLERDFVTALQNPNSPGINQQLGKDFANVMGVLENQMGGYVGNSKPYRQEIVNAIPAPAASTVISAATPSPAGKLSAPRV